MKRYLYILLVAVWAVVACEPISIEPEPKPEPKPEPEPTVDVNFGEINIQAADKSAEVRVSDTYLTIDGERYADAKIWVEYTTEQQDVVIAVEEYVDEEGCLKFVLNDLMPLTGYVAYVVVDGGEYGKHTSDRIGFSTTEEYIPFSGMNYNAVAQAKGIVAELSLSNLQYIYEDEEQAIRSVKVEYRLQNGDKRVAKEFAASSLANGSLSLNLPFEGEEYLVENSNYVVSVVLSAEGLSETFSADVCEFKTSYAAITAVIAAPELSYDESGIHASVNNVEIFYDGVSDKVYKSKHATKYAFQYREVGESEWTQIDVEAVDGTISTSIASDLLNDDATYQVKATLTAGVNNTLFESEVAEIVVPKQETPTPPTPPVEGGDSASLAGVWHLTQWRGAEPSFDVYLDIDAEGGLTLYQRIESRNWDVYTSSVALNDGVVRGTYTDGVAWGSAYNVTITQSSMTWVSVNDATDVSVYTRAELPEGLIEVATRSVVSNVRFL